MAGRPNTKPRMNGAMLYGFKAIMTYLGLRPEQLRRLMHVEGCPVVTHYVNGWPVVTTTKDMITRWFENRLNHKAMTATEYEVLAGWVRRTEDGEPIEKLAVIAELRKRRLLKADGLLEYKKIREDYRKHQEWLKERQQRQQIYEIANRTIDAE